jgi:hypothetical protein
MRSDSQLNCAKSCPQKYEDLSFDEWVDLHDSEPERFEKYRKKLLNNLVDSAPEQSKPRLRGLIFQMEAEAIKSKSQMAYNIRLSSMMMDMVDELMCQLNQLVTNNFKGMEQDHPPVKSAMILPYSRAPKTDITKQ